MLEGIMVAYLGCTYVPRTMKFTTFIDELVRKKNQFLANAGVIRSHLKLQEKDFLTKNVCFSNCPF